MSTSPSPEAVSDMTPDETPEVALAILKTKVENLEKGHGALEAKIDKLADKLNGFMLKTAFGTAGLTGLVQVVVNYVGSR